MNTVLRMTHSVYAIAPQKKVVERRPLMHTARNKVSGFFKTYKQVVVMIRSNLVDRRKV